MFNITFLVLKEEAEFLAEELRQHMPGNPGENPLTISVESAIPGRAISIESSTPFTLAQRRFLSSCGFPVSVRYYR